MKEKTDLFKGFLGDEFTTNYIKNSDIQMRMNITCISYWCRTLAEADDSECNCDFRTNVANNIIKYCCQIMKNFELYVNIFDAVKDDNINMTAIELNEFLNAFCLKCNSHLRDKCRIILKECNNAYIEINEKFFNFVLLMYVRMALSHKSNRVEISFSSEQDYLTICLKIENGKSDDNMCDDIIPDIFEDYFNDIVSVLLKKINGTVSYDGNCVYMRFPESESDALYSQKSYFLGEDLLNVFSIMLADFDDYKYY